MFIKTPIIRGFAEVSALFDLINDLGVICGGYARYCASPLVKPAHASDVDVYAYTNEGYTDLSKRLREHLPLSKENPVSLIFNTVTSGQLAYTPQINLIKPLAKGRMVTVGSVEDVIGNFDFTVSRAAIISPTEALVDEDFLFDETLQRLRLKNIHCPISSTLRCTKYVAKGYWLRPFDTLALFKDWEARDPEYRAEIEAALIELELAILEKRKLPQERVTALYELMKVD